MGIHIYPVARGKGFVSPPDPGLLNAGPSKGWAYRLVMNVYQPQWLWSRYRATTMPGNRQIRRLIRKIMAAYDKMAVCRKCPISFWIESN